MRPLLRRSARLIALSALALLVAGPLTGDAATQQEPPFSGMDNSVNKKLAEEAGAPARDPYIDTERMGELWNLLLLGAGGACGFVVGRRWHQIFDRPREESSRAQSES
jgi:hypothetical protein